jgi:hypothetical protein
MGTTAPLPPNRSGAPTAVSRGRCDRWVMAATSVPQGVRIFNHHPGCLGVTRTYRFSHGRRQSNEEHGKEQIIVRADAMWEGLFEFTYENARLEALHV